MKIKIILFALLLSIKTFQAQSIVILDSKTKKRISYVTILNTKEKTGFYTNEKGLFSLTKVNSDSVNISHIGYKTLILKVSEIKDTLFLKPNIETLEEVKLLTGKPKEKTIGYIKKEKTLSLSIKEKTELTTLIKYRRSYKSAYIKKIFIPICKMLLYQKNNKVIESFPSFNSVFRVHIYSNSNGKPNSRLLEKSLPIICNQKSPNIIEIDVSNKFIKFPKEGVFIGVEMIVHDKKKAVINSEHSYKLPTFQFTKKKKKNITSFSFFKNIFSDKKWINIDDYTKFVHISKYNMAVSLELSIYD